mmetsp:Transcript_18062/g.41630  ORF Transcript_18062/g.41630 Transcript_18062/m.41630 type:complete len:92 (+) Transcript_18062:73-348(+)
MKRILATQRMGMVKGSYRFIQMESLYRRQTPTAKVAMAPDSIRDEATDAAKAPLVPSGSSISTSSTSTSSASLPSPRQLQIKGSPPDTQRH